MSAAHQGSAAPARFCAAVALIGAVLTCLLPALPPGQDAAPHITTAAIIAAPEAYAEWYEVPGAPTAHAFETVMVALMHVVPLAPAARVTILALLVALALGTAAAARAVGGSAAVGLALGSAYGVGWTWAMGFYNFTAAMAFGVWAIPLLFGARARVAPWRRLLGAALLWLAAWAHIVAAAMLLVHLLVLRVSRLRLGTSASEARAPGHVVSVLTADAVTALPSLAYVLYWIGRAFGSAAHSGRVDTVGTRFGSAAELVRDLMMTSYGGFTDLGWMVTAAALGAVALALRDPTRRAPALVALGWILLMAAVPLHGMGWHFARPRCGYFAFALAIACLPPDRTRRVEAIVCSAAAAVVIAGIPGSVIEGQRAWDNLQSFGGAPSGRTLEVIFHPEPLTPSGPFVASALGHAHYATLHGGATPGAFATNAVKHSIRFRGGMAELFPATSTLGIQVVADCMADPECYRGDTWRADQIARTAVYWDSVALVGAPPGVITALTGRGFIALAPALFRADPAELRIPLPPGLRGELAWRVGYPDTVGPVSQGDATVDSDGGLVRIEHLLAGPTRVELSLDGRLILARDLDLDPGSVTELTLPSR